MLTAPSFSAALLAGGRSTRMGRDKALLPVPGSELVLWQRQWRLLEALKPEKLFWSGPVRPGLPDGSRVMADGREGVGPLAGISACLNALRSDLLVVLALDLPGMQGAFLQQLLAQCSTHCGVVIRHGDFFEPLAAVYPKSARALAADHLAQGRYVLQDFVRAAIARRLLLEFPLEPEDKALFTNWNAPEDLR